MDEFEAAFRKMQDDETMTHFSNLGKIVESWSDAERERYTESFPIRIWTVAGPCEDLSIAISAN